MKKYIIGTILAMALVIAVSYHQRGYWAAGSEIFYPALAVVLYTIEKEKKSHN